MIVFPAIDIKDGKCVRLKQGDFNQVDTFGTDPSEMAVRWEAEGGKYLHIVDLDGALKGNTANKEAVKRILERVHVPVQFGGGMRNEAAIKSMLDMGISRVILGTSALKDKSFTKDMIAEYKEKIAVSIDAKNGLVAVDGWTNVSETKAVDLAKELTAWGLKTIIYTDISKDGMMAGPNFEELDNMNTYVDADIIASGGVSTASDVKKLSEMKLYGAIIGKALYTGAIQLTNLKSQMEE
ncbi:MAG: 1-(5-phosphoribosyl)-5-[(5-phosphoribosylamino)methylideneamino]imidazole-4-carboxamide isomerase [Clostridia bacterium]|nr:1-(5-phosphoribosyl)-5-[(5-phosphoribosylamino)methylideneamino]imidazole-4-carboxamide isomerase [Clostridia bacterium]